MNREKFVTLLTKKISGEATDEDLSLLNGAASTSSEYTIISEGITKFDSGYAYIPKRKEVQLAKLLDKIKMEPPVLKLSAKKRTFNFQKIAAVFIVLAGVALFLLNQQKIKSKQLTELITIESGNKQLATTLPDGSHIVLEKGSSLKYNKDFGEKTRNVELIGQVSFDVAHDAVKPFIADAGNIRVSVKGTVFTINQNKQLSETEVKLLKGVIEVSDKNDQNNKITLKPGQLVTASTGIDKSMVFKVTEIPVRNNDNALTPDAIRFNKEKLKALAFLLEKKYNVTIDIKKEKLEEIRFTGVITNETLGEALDALKSSYPFTFTIKEGNVVIE